MAVTTGSFDLTGKVALITGAAGGLGQCFARTVHSAGASVVLCSRNLDRPELIALVKELTVDEAGVSANQSGAVCHVVEMDVTSTTSVAAAFKQLDADGVAPDILVNNAGIAISGDAHALDVNAWDQVNNTNLRGAWTVSQQFAQRIIENPRSASVINIASILGLQPSKGTVPYSVSKAGLIQMTRALALEWARYQIRVNAISPGYVETDINREFLRSDAAAQQIKKIPTRKLGEAEDLAGPLLLLASDAGRHMTGANIVVDGGHSCLSL